LAIRRAGSSLEERASEIHVVLAGGGATIPLLIPLVIDSGQPARANLSIDSGLLEAIDAAAAEAGVTRSKFLSSAAREKIEGRRQAHG
jgi:hypothetical protein